jgi:hypothetical protein
MPTSFVAREAVLQALVGHRVAAVFDHDGFAVEIANVRQRLGQDLRFDLRRHRSQVIVLVGCAVHWRSHE